MARQRKKVSTSQKYIGPGFLVFYSSVTEFNLPCFLLLTAGIVDSQSNVYWKVSSSYNVCVCIYMYKYIACLIIKSSMGKANNLGGKPEPEYKT